MNCRWQHQPLAVVAALCSIGGGVTCLNLVHLGGAQGLGFGGGASSGASSSAPTVVAASLSTASGNADSSGKLSAPGNGLVPAQAAPAPAVGGGPPPGLQFPPHQRQQPQPLAVQQAEPAPASGGTAPAQAAPAPATGAAPVCVSSGIPNPAGPVSLWSINDMMTYVDAISLSHLKQFFRENGLDDRLFLACTPEELLRELLISRLQLKQIMLNLPK